MTQEMARALAHAGAAEQQRRITQQRQRERRIAQQETAELIGNQQEATQQNQRATSSQPTIHEHELARVNSFVRRSARLDARLQRAWNRYADEYLLDLNAGEHSLSVAQGVHIDAAFIEQSWGALRPLTVEIGSGQGENIVAAALAHPERNFLAVEVYDPGVAHTLLLAGKQGVRNLRVAHVNAPELMAACAGGALQELWTFFPDPWPKMRHHKRRLVQSTLADEVHRALETGGIWRIATDIEDYALHVHEVMDARADFRPMCELTVSLSLQHVGKGNAAEAALMEHGEFAEAERFEGRIITNFERKGLEAGRRIHDMAYEALAELVS